MTNIALCPLGLASYEINAGEGTKFGAPWRLSFLQYVRFHAVAAVSAFVMSSPPLQVLN